MKQLINYILSVLVNDLLPSLWQLHYSALVEVLGFLGEELIQVVFEEVQ